MRFCTKKFIEPRGASKKEAEGVLTRIEVAHTATTIATSTAILREGTP